uniref:Immunoglobulin domain protein n=1 Tax=Caenorhabditis tropicalis TaxID=1561998 RepID=A0A1I7USJ1_9PELO
MLFFLLVLLNSALTFAAPPHAHMQVAVASLVKEIDAQQLTSKPMLKVTSGLEDVKIPAGESYTLHCEILSTPGAAVYWLRNGKRIQGNMDLNVEEKMLNLGKKVVESGILASQYTIECPTSEDAGTYTCIAYNGHQTVQSSAVIEIEGSNTACKPSHRSAPRIVQWTESRFEMQGNYATLVCRSNEAVDWAWTFDGELITEDRYEVMANGDLRIKDIAWEDMGEYFCIARNKYGETRQETFLYPTSKKTD